MLYETYINILIALDMIKFARKLNDLDRQNKRKIHKLPIPTLGGLVIFISFMIGLMIVQPSSDYHIAILCGGFVILVLGFFDDLYNLTAKAKFLGQIVAAVIVVFGGGLQAEFINLPFGGQVEFGLFSTVITLLWIIGITNAINLIDGLDGLAAGISAIALFSIAVMAFIMGNVYVMTMALILFFSIIGFLPYNFFPAKIFMGDTGALFLGYMISVLSLLGFKNVTFVSFVIPIFILAVPIFDTLIAMTRRIVQRRPMTSPDSSHLHHRLLKLGFTHRQTVIFIYVLSGMFSLVAILFSMSMIWGSIIIGAISLLVFQLLVETLELVDHNFKPLTNFVRGRFQNK